MASTEAPIQPAFQLSSTWNELLGAELEKPYLQQLSIFLESERAKGLSIYPPKGQEFTAFNLCSFESVKVVVMGQDPYHGQGQAHGLSFSVQKGCRIPPSLKNIYKELETDLEVPPAEHGCLTSWAEQGVLMLNATLTVEAAKPKSHYGLGWEKFTDAVIEKLCEREDPLVFILWGKSAKEKCEAALAGNTKHLVITSPHPSPYSASSGFFSSKPFSKANAFLEKNGKSPVNWQVS